MWSRSVRKLLTRHFLQRFLENDLISPDADRHEVLSTASAVLISSGLFVTILLGVKYLVSACGIKWFGARENDHPPRSRNTIGALTSRLAVD